MIRNSPYCGRQPRLGHAVHEALGAEPVPTSCATVMNVSPCSSAKRSSAGRLAIVPSAFRISQITPAGFRPARRARSTAASV